MTTHGFVKTLAPPLMKCPKCDYMNDDKKGLLWLVADERGPHLECDQCDYHGPVCDDLNS